ncbi:MAG: hypothetical protein Q9218_006478 [Villophora microphyllina]
MPNFWESIDYEWMIDRPDTEAQAKRLMQAAYHTTKKVDPNITKVLITGDIHDKTWWGEYLVADDPHITIRTKTQDQVNRGEHSTAHGYTEGMNKYNVIDGKSNGVVKGDHWKDRNGKPCWPTNVYQEPKKQPNPQPKQEPKPGPPKERLGGWS